MFANPILFSAEQNREIYSFETEKDPQGIQWTSTNKALERNQARTNLISQFQSFRCTSQNLELGSNVISEACYFFSFRKNHVIDCEKGHFQLRDNIKVISPTEIYSKVKDNKVAKYNPLNKKSEIVCSPSFHAITFDVFNEFIVLGGSSGDLMLTTIYGDDKFLYKSSISYSMNNSVKFFNDGILRILIGSNDRSVRVIDPETKENLTDIICASCVNHVSISKDFNQIAVCLDDIDDYVLDRRTGEVSVKLVGHTDYGFCVDWNPNKDFELATGNQDLSVMIWDTRNGSQPVSILKGAIGAAYYLKYSQNGKYLVCSESRDYLNIYDTGNIKERQVLDYFGEISGFDFEESDQENLRIFLGIDDRSFGSIIELHENSQPPFLI